MQIIRFNAKGWRTRFDDGFDEMSVARVADAFGYIWADARPGATVYVGYDTRYEARRHAQVAAQALATNGLNAVLSDGYCPTPALGWMVMHDQEAIGGVMITASGASCEYGGISARAQDGGPVSEEFYDAVSRIVSSVPVNASGNFTVRDFVSPYLQSLAQCVDEDAIREASLKVVVDPMYGAGRGHLARMLRNLGCRVHEIHGESMPDFAGLHPTPTEPWVDTCEQAVRSYGCDVGLVLDGDADRMALIDEKGRLITPHRTVPLVMDHLVVNRGEAGRIVDTFSSSAYVRRQAKRLNCPFTAVPMGFKRIHSEFVEGDVLLGADEFGGISIPRHMPERDGLLTALLIVEELAVRAKKVSALVEELEQNLGTMHYIRRDMRLDAASIQAFRNILPGLNPPEVCGLKPVMVSHSDGLVLRFSDDSWVQLRPSRTDALVRACAEAPEVRVAEGLAEGACKGALANLP